MPSAGTVRGNEKRLGRGGGPDKRKTTIQADASVVEEHKQAIQDRLKLATVQTDWLDQHLVMLTSAACDEVGPEDLDRHKKRVDVAVKLRASWEKVTTVCQRALGIVTERATRTAQSAQVESGQDEVERLRSKFQKGA